MKLVAVLLCVLGVCSAARRVRLPERTVTYEGERVFHCRDAANISLSAPGLDVWAEYSDKSIDVRVIPSRGGGQLLDQLSSSSSCKMVIDDVEQYVREFEKKMEDAAVKAEWHEAYHTYEEIYMWYSQLATNHPELVRFVTSIGRSTEDRQQPAVHIFGGSSGNETRRRIYFQCQIHAREWISGATCMYVVDYLVTNYGIVQEVTDLLNEVELFLVPFANPDGYEYTWNGDRLWRKNRRVNSGSSCRGVDQNRNYNIQWGQSGSSSNPCSETYHGTAAESEPETQNTVRYFKENEPILGAIDWHSYSQLVLRPWGYTETDAKDEVRMRQIGDEMSDLIYSVNRARYTSQKSIGLYPTSGTASDWFYSEDANSGNLGYRAAGFTVELRDTGRYGFLLPPDQIIPTGKEIVPAAMYFMKTLADQPIYL